MYILIFIIFCFALALGATQEEYDVITSPNQNYNIVCVEYDEGALGGSIEINLVKINTNKKDTNVRTLYKGRWGERPSIAWIDNNIIMINNRVMNVFKDKTWDNY